VRHRQQQNYAAIWHSRSVQTVATQFALLWPPYALEDAFSFELPHHWVHGSRLAAGEEAAMMIHHNLFFILSLLVTHYVACPSLMWLSISTCNSFKNFTYHFVMLFMVLNIIYDLFVYKYKHLWP
jgi:hypothetical protein